ncbi:hypothetical protein ANRL1_01331 [Anaerolineae bacterium]|nr:hypothetical protein ANRL1_01331 [Anaerolineae bacterium]
MNKTCSDVCEYVTDELVGLGFKISDDAEDHVDDALKALDATRLIRKCVLLPFNFVYREGEIFFTVLATDEHKAEEELHKFLNTGHNLGNIIVSIGDLHSDFIQFDPDWDDAQ